MTANILTENKQLKEYATELEHENKARDHERLKLEEEIERLSNSRKSDVLYVPAACTSCQKYKTQIFQLQKRIKHLQETEYINIDKSRKIQWNNSDEMGNYRQENIKLVQENKVLLEKIAFIEDRVLLLQGANKILREQILNKMGQSKTVRFENYLHPTHLSFNQNNYLSPLNVKMYENESKSRQCYAPNKSMLQQEYWESLQRKIQILDRQNNELRSKLWKK